MFIYDRTPEVFGLSGPTILPHLRRRYIAIEVEAQRYTATLTGEDQ